MSELSYKELQEQGVFGVPYRAFEYIQSQQAKIDELQARIDGALEKCYTGIRKQGGDHYLELVEDILKGNKDEN